MIITRNEVFSVIDTQLPFQPMLSEIDPKFFKAICIKEAEGVPNHPDEFDLSVARLEQGFYRGYVKKENWSTVVEVMLSASYGVTQMMGLSLHENHYFEDVFKLLTAENKALYHPAGPLDSAFIARRLDEYCVTVDTQIRYTFLHMIWKLRTAKSENFLSTHPTWRQLPLHWRLARLWNGDISGVRGYAEGVESIMKTL